MKAPSLQKITERMDDVLDLLDSAAKRYPIKALAYELKSELSQAKAESTLRNELNQQPGYKLGLVTAVQIMAKTGDLTPLDAVEALFNRTAFPLPDTVPGDLVPVLSHMGRVSKEFSEVLQEVSRAMEDHELSKAEIERCLSEIADLIECSVRFKALLENLLRARGRMCA